MTAMYAPGIAVLAAPSSRHAADNVPHERQQGRLGLIFVKCFQICARWQYSGRG